MKHLSDPVAPMALHAIDQALVIQLHAEGRAAIEECNRAHAETRTAIDKLHGRMLREAVFPGHSPERRLMEIIASLNNYHRAQLEAKPLELGAR